MGSFVWSANCCGIKWSAEMKKWVVLASLLVSTAADAQSRTPPTSEEIFAPIATLVARAVGLEPKIALAIIRQESGFNPAATSKKGAMGLMQLMPETAKAYGVLQPYDPVQNLIAGLYHYRLLLQKYQGDHKLALAAYNAGETAVKRFGGIPPYRETVEYVKRIVENAGLNASQNGQNNVQEDGNGEAALVLQRRPSPYTAKTEIDLSRLVDEKIETQEDKSSVTSVNEVPEVPK
jgi:soluble lytic murein transglycosylase-like protein